MPQEFQSSVRIYKYPFELVMKVIVGSDTTLSANPFAALNYSSSHKKLIDSSDSCNPYNVRKRCEIFNKHLTTFKWWRDYTKNRYPLPKPVFIHESARGNSIQLATDRCDV